MNRFVPRLLGARLLDGLAVSPVVVITGARQTGKSTLVRTFPPRSRRYLSLDDFDIRAQAEVAPDELVTRAPALTLDEVQRAPQLLISVKRAVDENREPGRFLLTGSANLLLMRQVSETLAGRSIYFTLMPFTRRERLGFGSAGIWSELFASPEDKWASLIAAQEPPRENWKDVVKIGGYPTPAIEIADQAGRELWFTGYTQTYLERDLQDLAALSNLVDFRRLMTAASLRLGQLLNQSELARDVGLPQPTVHRYLNLLEASYQIVRIPVYAVNRTKRLIKTPKLYWTDVGLAMYLSGTPAAEGRHLENLILSDLLSWRGSLPGRAEILYWRTATQEEVDFVVEFEGALLPIEIKASSRIGFSDIHHLRLFRSEYAGRTRGGLLLHDGDDIEWMAPGILAAPWWRVI